MVAATLAACAPKDGETDRDGSPAGCEEADPSADAGFELSFQEWDAGQFADVDVPCAIDAVTVAGDAVTTAMTCEVDGASEPASLRFAVAAEGPVDWEAGLAVRLRIEKNFEFATKRIVQLRAAADDEILVVAVSGGTDNNSGYADAFLPLSYGYSQACEAGDTEGGAPGQIDLGGPGEAELHLGAHHRGSLPIDAEHAYAVDVGEVAVGGSNNFPVSQEVLLRRIRVGG
ncbi:hypothetical protein OV090_36850 [Nannocystis sp. RBIL2]|nr:hypothetical protein [Nannocystis sp. RBIL2]MCY1070371.1 hypothetical protein [Nannocystis sp. RBIL2]